MTEGAASPPLVQALIVDMDNTLYDWVASFVPAFYTMMDVAAPLLGVEPDGLVAQMREVHRAANITERPYALLDAPVARARFGADSGDDDWRERAIAGLAPAFEAFDAKRAETMRLYPGVESTLRTIRDAGCRVFAHTEASHLNVRTRLKLPPLRPLIGLLEAVFTPEYVGPLRKKRDESQPDILDGLRIELLPAGTTKPNPQVATSIVKMIGIPAPQCLYVGDSRLRDVDMAKEAGLLAAHARYGERHDRALLQRLWKISHRDPGAEPPPRYDADDTLHKGFSDLIEDGRFRFAGPN